MPGVLWFCSHVDLLKHGNGVLKFLLWLINKETKNEN